MLPFRANPCFLRIIWPSLVACSYEIYVPLPWPSVLVVSNDASTIMIVPWCTVCKAIPRCFKATRCILKSTYGYKIWQEFRQQHCQTLREWTILNPYFSAPRLQQIALDSALELAILFQPNMHLTSPQWVWGAMNWWIVTSAHSRIVIKYWIWNVTGMLSIHLHAISLDVVG